MDIALPAIVIFFVLFPGFLARARFRVVERESIDYSPFGQVLAEAFIWAIALHTLWIIGSIVLLDRYPDPETFLHLLDSSTSEQSKAISAVARDWRWVTSYFAILILACLIIPSGIQSLILKYRLDSPRSQLGKLLHLRSKDAEWYYLLVGRDRKELPDAIYASTICQFGSKTVVCDGLLCLFEMDKDGKLDYIALKPARLRDFEADEKASQFVANPQDESIFFLYSRDINTLNIKYVYAHQVPTEDGRKSFKITMGSKKTTISIPIRHK